MNDIDRRKFLVKIGLGANIPLIKNEKTIITTDNMFLNCIVQF